jgi:outer membrane protein assembly factor BamD (BamD/ComL family)
VAQDRNNTEQARALLRGYMARFATSPDAAYQRYAQTQVEEGCETFSRMHNATTAGQRLKAVQSLKGYEQDFWLLAAQ